MMTKPAAKRPKAPPGSYTRKAHEVRAKAAKQTSDVVTAALEWCLKEKKGSKAAEHSGLFPGVTYNMIEPRLKKLKKKKTTPEVGLRSHHAQLLTDTERVKVGKWIAGCADGHCPKDRSQISQKIIAVLKARHKSNKQRKHGVGTVALNQAELDAVSAGGELSHRFFQRFYEPWCRARGIDVEEGTDRAQDVSRAQKMVEPVVQRHFYVEAGLKAELIDAGIMDPDTELIKDPRRILNSDETPQPLDLPQKGSRKKVGKRTGKACRRSTTQNKESVSVNMTWDVSGHMYGVQLVLKRKTLTEDMDVAAPDGAMQFDGMIDVMRKQTRDLLLSRSPEGMQTETTFLEFLQALDKQITARSDAEVAAGRTAIERPVTLMLDNHASRFGEGVLEATAASLADDDRFARLGIRLFTEEPKTSGFLQSLDQYNSKFHREYNTALKTYKQAYETRYGQALSSVSLSTFLAVMGGDDELQLPGMWFTWCSAFDVIRAWQKVGISGNRLAPELIDRSEFIDREQATGLAAAAAAAPSPSASRCAVDVAKTPEGMQSGSAEALAAQRAALLDYAQRLESQRDAPFDPAPLLAPEKVSKPQGGRRQSKLSDKHGSHSLLDLRADKRQRLEEEKAAQERTAASKRQKQADKEKAAQEKAATEEAFSRCEQQCTCGETPCPWQKWKRSKRGLCKVRACREARQPLLLTHDPALDGPL